MKKERIRQLLKDIGARMRYLPRSADEVARALFQAGHNVPRESIACPLADYLTYGIPDAGFRPLSDRLDLLDSRDVVVGTTEYPQHLLSFISRLHDGRYPFMDPKQEERFRGITKSQKRILKELLSGGFPARNPNAAAQRRRVLRHLELRGFTRWDNNGVNHLDYATRDSFWRLTSDGLHAARL